MASELRTSEAGLKLIMAYEGFRSHSTRLPDGRWVIGYGHLKAAREGLRVSQAEAAAILREFDLPPIEQAISDLVLVLLNQNEFDALVSFVFNIGIDQFEASSVLEDLNAGDRMMAASAMERWRKARVGARDMVVDPLVRRRADEKALFLKTVGAVPLAASSRFRPLQEDHESFGRPARPYSVIDTPQVELRETMSRPLREGETPTEAAARNVRERLTRILGEHEYEHGSIAGLDPLEPEEETETHDADEASVEEIRAAISALVADDEEEGELSDADAEAGPDAEDDPFDFTPGALHVNPHRSRNGGRLYIDDVSPVEIPPADPTLHAERSGEGAGEILLYVFVALAGALLLAYGAALGLGLFGIQVAATGMAAYKAPFLMLFGGLIFIVMTYYALRALSARD